MTQARFLCLFGMALLALASSPARSSWPRMPQLQQLPDETTSETDERFALSSLGLRRIQRRPELIDPLDERLQDEGREEDSTTSYQSNIAGRLYDKRSSQSLVHGRNSDGGVLKAQPEPHEFIYVVAPISEQVLPFQRSKVDQGYKNFVALSGPNYKTGLQKLTSQAGRAEEEFVLSGQRASSAGCRTVRSSIQLARDDIDPGSGQLLRHCAGLVQLNTCEGQCISSIEPSIKAPSGFVKKCFCCNEGSLRRVQVRLNDCWLPQAEVAKLTGTRQPAGHMDVFVDEPAECRCRPCDSII